MAASAWSFYNSFREYVGKAEYDIVADVFKMAIFTNSTTTVTTKTLSTYASLNGEVANGNGYLTGGKNMASKTWASVATDKYRFGAANLIWTASGGTISNIQYAVLYKNSGKLIAYSQLTTTAFNLATDNTLTIAPSANGIFELS
ncbi:MAG: hypothetical protein MK386_08045 [Candidatus Thioglobus autotrophicus]|nr:hypothetical protein [Candidatus Thioglobus autotrophicus]